MGTASSMVEQLTLNQLVGGSSPSRCKLLNPYRTGVCASSPKSSSNRSATFEPPFPKKSK